MAFETIHEFLGAHRFAAKLASNSVVQYALWMQDLDPGQHERLIRWWQDDIEGTGRVPILTAENKPEVLRFGAGTDADLRLNWQEFLIRVIASAFDLPPLFLGIEADVNYSTAQKLAIRRFVRRLCRRRGCWPSTLRGMCLPSGWAGTIWNSSSWIWMPLAGAGADRPDPVNCKVLTVNEARAARGWQPLDGQGVGG